MKRRSTSQQCGKFSMMSSKAQGLSLNAIIIAVIVLVVLLIILGITWGYFGKRWVPGFSNVSDTSCGSQGGQAKASCDASTENEIFTAQVAAGQKCCAGKTCEDMGGICCIRSSLPLLRSKDPGCKAKDVNIPNCCSS